MPRSRQPYPPEFRVEAIPLAKTSGEPIRQIATSARSKSRGPLRGQDRADVGEVHRFIRAEWANHAVATLRRVLEVSRAGFYGAPGAAVLRRVASDEDRVPRRPETCRTGTERRCGTASGISANG